MLVEYRGDGLYTLAQLRRRLFELDGLGLPSKVQRCQPPLASRTGGMSMIIGDVGAMLDDMTRTEGVELISGSGSQGDLP